MSLHFLKRQLLLLCFIFFRVALLACAGNTQHAPCAFVGFVLLCAL